MTCVAKLLSKTYLKVTPIKARILPAVCQTGITTTQHFFPQKALEADKNKTLLTEALITCSTTDKTSCASAAHSFS